MNLLFLIVGALAAFTGLLLLVTALRGRVGESRKSTAQLIAGMMILAFGLVLAGFAVAYATTKPYPEFRNETAS
jgi:cytochrome c biogenesis protein CcdA